MRQKRNRIFKSKVHAFFILSRKSIEWVGSKAGREVNGHRAKIQGPVHMEISPSDKQAALGTTQRGRRQWDGTRRGRTSTAEAPKTEEVKGIQRTCSAIWGEGDLQCRERMPQCSELQSEHQKQHPCQTRGHCYRDRRS